MESVYASARTRRWMCNAVFATHFHRLARQVYERALSELGDWEIAGEEEKLYCAFAPCGVSTDGLAIFEVFQVRFLRVRRIDWALALECAYRESRGKRLDTCSSPFRTIVTTSARWKRP